MKRAALADRALFRSPLIESTLARREQLLRQLGTLAFEEFVRLVDDPTPETAAGLTSIWVVTLYPRVLNALLRELPEAQRDIERCFAALRSVRQPIREDHGPIRFCPYDTLEEQRGER